MAEQRRRSTHKRPWLAAVLSFVYPGLGHVYLREWLRGLLWFGLAIGIAAITIPTAAVPPAGSEFSFEAVLQATSAVPQSATLVIFGVIVLSVIDAYRLAAVGNTRADTDAGLRCPECGHELDDPDLDFCPWCTAPLDGRPESESRTETGP
jgi:hypothetical protein